MKNFFRDIHLYLSLASGLVIAVVCFTGAVLVFEKELQQSLYPERYTVQPQPRRLPADALVAAAQAKLPAAKITGFKHYADPARTVEISFTEKKEGKGGDGKKGGERKKAAAAGSGKKAEGSPEAKADKGGKGGRPPQVVAFMNPYTGELIGTHNQRHPFFQTMFELHRWLLVREPGKLIVGVGTVFFLFILLTGIVLWWPKNQKMLRQRLRLKWNAGWKRLNHDLHIVVGFYTAIVLFVLAFTGLAWSFEWFNDGIYKLTGTENKRPEPPAVALADSTAQFSFGRLLAAAEQAAPNAEYYSLSQPKETTQAATVTLMPADAVHERASDQLYLHPETAELLGTNRYAERNLGQRVRATFYPVHVGSIGGWPTRILAFISCIAGFTFPITGVVLWINRLNKKKKKKLKKVYQ